MASAFRIDINYITQLIKLEKLWKFKIVVIEMGCRYCWVVEIKEFDTRPSYGTLDQNKKLKSSSRMKFAYKNDYVNRFMRIYSIIRERW